MSERWLTVLEAAALWRVTPWTIRQWIKRGEIEAVQFTKRGRYRIPIVTEGGEGDAVREQEQGREAEEVRKGA